MHIRYIGHAGLAIDVAGHHIVCDPWWNGTAFAGQWHPFPRPAPQPIDTAGVDLICLSHAHEDHFHVPTLRLLRRDALVLLPRLRDPGLYEFVRSLGFERVIEMSHGVRREVLPGVFATCWIVRDDSILVLEGGGRTLVNANDALQAAPHPVVEDLCEAIRARSGRPDVLVAQCGSSSWFPHAMQVTDDVGFDIGACQQAARERFAAMAAQLGARMSLPLEPAFLVLDEPAHARNALRLDAAAMRTALRRAGTEDAIVHLLSPGDRIVNDSVRPAGARRPGPEDIAAALRGELAVAVAERRQHRVLEPARVEALVAALQANARRRAARALRDCAPLRCRVDLRDAPEISILVQGDAHGVEVARCDRLRLAPVVLTTRFEVLEALAQRDGGDEAIRLGGGATLQLRRRDLALAEPVLTLLGRRPMPPTSGESLAAWLRHPRRAMEAGRRDRRLRRLVRRLVHGPRLTPVAGWRGGSAQRAAADHASAG